MNGLLNPFTQGSVTAKRPYALLLIAIFFFALRPSGFAEEITAEFSTLELKAGDAFTVTGRIPPGKDIIVVICDENRFRAAASRGSQEKEKLAGMFGQTEIPATYYILSNVPEQLATPTVSQKGKWFPPFKYQVKVNKTRKWEEVPATLRTQLGPIQSESQWNMLIFAHEDRFGINTITKEKPVGGGNARMILSDHDRHPERWNDNVRLALSKSTGEYSMSMIPNRNLAPGTSMVVYINGRLVGKFNVRERGYYFAAAGTYMMPVVVFLGTFLIGIMFAIVGAAGGLFTAAFQIVVIGTQGMIGINAANVIKPTNLFLTVFSPISGVWTYFRERRLAWPVAACLVSGIAIGAFWVGPTYSARYLPMQSYTFYLGFFCLLLSGKLLLESTQRGIEAKRGVKAIVQKYDQTVKKAKSEGKVAKIGVVTINRFTPTRIDLVFWDEKFKANPVALFLGGLIIGCIASAFGVGGGFMLVPFMTSVMHFPMYLAVPVALCGTFATSIGGVARYVLLGYHPDWIMAALIAAGAIIGGTVGSKIQKRIPEILLKRFLALFIFIVFLKLTGVLPVVR